MTATDYFTDVQSLPKTPYRTVCSSAGSYRGTNR
jgi:hypothetical protein